MGTLYYGDNHDIGSTEDLRHPMIEAPITSFPVHAIEPAAVESEQMGFFEKPLAEFNDFSRSK